MDHLICASKTVFRRSKIVLLSSFYQTEFFQWAENFFVQVVQWFKIIIYIISEN